MTSYITLSPGLVQATAGRAINVNGRVVGSYTDAAGSHGFVYVNGIYTAINASGADGTFAVAINGTGQIAGYYSDGSGIHGFEYVNGSVTTLDGSGADLTVALGIDAAGTSLDIFTMVPAPTALSTATAAIPSSMRRAHKLAPPMSRR